MATFEYHGPDFANISLTADDGEEIPMDVAQTFALLQIGGALDTIGRAMYDLVEEVRGLNSIEVELKK